MSNELRARAVNWVNGMKVKKDHFIQLERYIDDRLRDALFFAKGTTNFGILKQPICSMVFSDVKDQENSSSIQLRVEVSACSGITRDGYRIQIPWGDNDLQAAQKLQFEGSTRFGFDYYVVVRISGERFPTGNVAEEGPSRLSDVVPGYEVAILNKQETLSEGKGIPIGKVLLSTGKPEIENDYVPPCIYVSANERLSGMVTHISDLIENAKELAVRVAFQEMETGNRSPEFTAFANQAAHLFANSSILNLANLAPLYVLEAVLRLTNSIRIGFECMPHARREELYRDFTSRADFFSRDKFDGLESRLIMVVRNYDGIDLRYAFKATVDYLEYVHLLFKSFVVQRRKGVIVK